MTEKKPARTQHEQVMDMEGQIENIINSSSVLYRVLDGCFGHKHTEVTGSPNRYHLTDGDISDMYFTANLISGYVNKLKDQWQSALEAAQ